MPNGVSEAALRPPEPQKAGSSRSTAKAHRFFRNISVESVSAAPGSEVAAHGADQS